jgi:hypothetical protein
MSVAWGFARKLQPVFQPRKPLGRCWTRVSPQQVPPLFACDPDLPKTLTGSPGQSKR